MNNTQAWILVVEVGVIAVSFLRSFFGGSPPRP